MNNNNFMIITASILAERNLTSNGTNESFEKFPENIHNNLLLHKIIIF